MFKSFLRFLKWDIVGKRAILAFGFTVGSWRQYRKLYEASQVIWLTLISFVLYTVSCILSAYANELKNTGANDKMRFAVDLAAIVFMAFGMFGHLIWG